MYNIIETRNIQYLILFLPLSIIDEYYVVI